MPICRVEHQQQQLCKVNEEFARGGINFLCGNLVLFFFSSFLICSSLQQFRIQISLHLLFSHMLCAVFNEPARQFTISNRVDPSSIVQSLSSLSDAVKRRANSRPINCDLDWIEDEPRSYTHHPQSPAWTWYDETPRTILDAMKMGTNRWFHSILRFLLFQFVVSPFNFNLVELVGWNRESRLLY